MSWLRRTPLDGDAAAMAATVREFGGLVDRGFAADDDAIARVRAGVLGAFIEAAPTQPRPSARRVGRRFALASAGMVVLLAVSTVAVSARAGGALYPVRMAVEAAMLAPLDAPSGWDARLARLDVRMTEAAAAGRDSDIAGVVAALDEYRAEFRSLASDLTDPARRASLTGEATRDLARLTTLQAAHPTDAGVALQTDLEAFLGVEETPPSSPAIAPVDEGRPPIHDEPARDSHPAGTTGDPHPDGATGNPHQDGATGDPHADGATGNPHQDGAKGDPHQDGAKGDPHVGKQPKGPAKDHARSPKGSSS